MTELTKEERNGLYYIMLAEAQENVDILRKHKRLLDFCYPFGLCEILEGLTKVRGDNFGLDSLEELMKQKPKGQDCYWFHPRNLNGWKKRVKVLKKAILWTNS